MKLFFHNIYSRLKEKFPYLATRQSKVVIPLLLLTLALPLTVFLAQQQQELRQHASTNQASLAISQDTVHVGESMTVEWTISQDNQPQSSPTPIPPANPTNTPTPSTTEQPTATPLPPTETPVPPSPTPNCTKYTVTDFGAAGTNGSERTIQLAVAAGNPISKIVVTNAEMKYSILSLKPGETEAQIQPQIFYAPETITIPAGVTSIYIFITNSPNYNGTAISGNIFDNCGSHPFSLSLSQGAVLGQATTDVIPKAYAQTTITGAETLQLYSTGASESAGTPEAVKSEPIGFPLYLNCTQKQESPTGPIKEPPANPILTGSCQYQIAQGTKAGSYIFRVLASDGQTVLGESPVFKVTSPEEEKNCVPGQTFAQDSFGTACKSFTNSCDVPEDWTVVQSCPSKANKRSALPTIPGDLNYDDRIGLPDFSIMLNCFKRGKSCMARKIPADLNGDNSINELDFDVLISNYEKFKQSSQSAGPVNPPSLKPGNSGVNKQPFPKKGR